MKMKTILPVLLMITFVACTRAQPPLPAQWQPGMKLTMTSGGGKRYGTATTVISADSSIKKYEGGHENYSFTLPVTKTDLDSLALYLRQQQFHKIKTRPRNGVVYDMPTSTLTLVCGGRTFAVSTGAAQEVLPAYKENLSNVYNYLYRLIESKKPKAPGK
jgi:hypothetical protein